MTRRIVLACLVGLGCASEPRGPSAGSTSIGGSTGSTGAASSPTTGPQGTTTTSSAAADSTSTGSVTSETGSVSVGDSTGDPSADVACLPGAFIDALTEPFSCEAMPQVAAPVSMLPFDCHTQGIGRDPTTGRVIVTCQDEGGGSSGRVLSFPADGDDAWQATHALELYVDDDTPHPSAIQLDADGNFVVAMARREAAGPSVFESLNVAADGGLSVVAASWSHEAGHVGATAQANLDGATMIVGCGWDCATVSVHTAPEPNATAGFTLVLDGPTEDFVAPGVDENVGQYNALYLGQRCEDAQPLLVATHGDWLDVWALDDLGSESMSMSKIANRQIDEDVVQWMGRPIFYEGMTLEIADEAVWVWAAPHDFGTNACPDGTRCMQYVYRCRFG